MTALYTAHFSGHAALKRRSRLEWGPRETDERGKNMNALLIIIAIVAIILLFIGGFAQAVQWLLWVGIVLLIIAIIVWLLRFLSGRRSV